MKKSIFGKIISKVDLALVYKTKTGNKFLYWSFHPGIKRTQLFTSRIRHCFSALVFFLFKIWLSFVIKLSVCLMLLFSTGS